MATLVGSLADNTDTNADRTPQGDLVGWIMERVNRWRDDRNSTYEKVWGEYYRLWRGRHIDIDRTRATERSRLVSPALSQALEMTVAELEEATFGRENWIDVLDDVGDPDHNDLGGARRLILDDLARDGVPDAISACYLNGGLWGTLAAKVVVEQLTEPVFSVDPATQDSPAPRMQVRHVPRVKIKVVPIPVTDLIPDPDGTCIDDMLGIAHEVAKPRAWLLTQKWGREYASSGSGADSSARDEEVDLGDHESLLASKSNDVLVTEYHGKVPRRLLDPVVNAAPRTSFELALEDPLAAAEVGTPKDDETPLDGDGDMVEAIVTILDKTELGVAMENPFLMKDRSIVACQFERVPNRFFGRGVMEKGYNPQKALDAEVRTRMDVMALVSNPMMGADSTSLPRGFDMRVRPGKVWMTNGNPKDALFPVQFPGLDPSSFTQTSEMERMVQMGTGAMDTATPVRENRRNETATGTSLIAGTFVKRSKRALRHITNNFVEPLVQKILWRRMEYDTLRYPKDLQFRVSGTLGIVAREVEQNQMTQMLGLVPEGSATQRSIVRSIFDASSSPYKAELDAAIEQDAQPDPAAQRMQQLQETAAQIEVQNKAVEMQLTVSKTKLTEADVIKRLAEVEKLLQEPGVELAELEIERQRLFKELGELREFSRQNDIALAKVMADLQIRGTDGQQRADSD